MADVRDGLGPYLSVYLKGSLNWSAGDIVIAVATSSVAAAALSVRICRPAVDTSRAYRRSAKAVNAVARQSKI